MPSMRPIIIVAIGILLSGSCQRSEPATLPPGGALHGELTAGEERRWTIKAAAGEVIELQLTQDDRVALRVEIHAPDGDNVGQRRPKPFLYIAVIPGDYEVRIKAARDLDRPAPFTIARLPNAPLADDVRREFLAVRKLRLALEDKQSTDPAVKAALPGKIAEARAEFEAIGDRGRVADTDFELAVLAELDGRFDEAHRLVVQADAIFREVDDLRGQADAQEMLGSLEAQRGNFNEARARYALQTQIAGQLGDERRLGNAHASLAEIAFRTGDFGAAVESLERSAAHHRRIPDDPTRLFAIELMLGVAYDKSGDIERAIEHSQRAEAVARAADEPLWIAKAVANRGFVHLRLLDAPAVALEHFEAAAPAFESYPLDYANLLEAMARAKLGLGRLDEALADLDRAMPVAIESGAPRQVAEMRTTRGLVLAALGSREARAELQIGLDLSREVRDEAFAARAQVGLARVARADGDRATARRHLEGAIATFEEMRTRAQRVELRTTFFGMVRETYDMYLDLLWSDGDTAAAFVASERARARQLLDALSPGAAATALPEVVNETEALRRLEPGTALVELAVTDERTLAWVFEGGTIERFELSGRRTLAPLVRNWHAALGARGEHPDGELPGARRDRIAAADRRAAAAETALGAALAPLFDRIEARRIVMVPDGTLFLVPWAALPHPGGGTLVGSREIAIAPSLSWLAARRHARPPRRSPDAPRVALIADPLLSADPRRADDPVLIAAREEPLARLVGSRQEAEAIAALLPPEDVHLALDGDASLLTLRRDEVRDARVLHLATHAIVDDHRADRSRLVLSTHDAAGHPIDGELDVAGIAALGGNHELVVLSACRSALGREIRGEGLVGLAHAFLASGASGVVASLWPVEDGPTAVLMTEMYKGMLHEGLTASAALAAAQRRIAADPRWSSPYYWAGFVVLGDPRVSAR
jgi:CHAT domain-containing protein/tetratricopeptide (TPR) repeat protein